MKNIGIIIASFMIIAGWTGLASSGSATNRVTTETSTKNVASGPSSGDKAIAISNSAINLGSGKASNTINVETVTNMADGENAIAISNTTINTAGGTVSNYVNKNNVVNKAKEDTVSIRNSIVKGKIPK